MSTIEVSHLSKSFGQIKVLSDISLHVSEGEFFGLFGSNGAGKTTLIKILTGQLAPDSGTAYTAGHPISDPIAVKKALILIIHNTYILKKGNLTSKPGWLSR